MISYCRNIDTGKIHKIELLTWSEAEFDPIPMDKLPLGEIEGVPFKIENNKVHLLDSNKVKWLKTK